MYISNIGIVIIKCHGHEYSMEKRDTTVINLDAHPDHATLYRVKNDPKVAALLHSLGVKREEQYRRQDNKKLNKLVSYTMTATDGEKPKYLIKKLAELLPGYFDEDDKELIYSVIDEKVTEVGQQKRQTVECFSLNITTTGYTITTGPTATITSIEIDISGDRWVINIEIDC